MVGKNLLGPAPVGAQTPNASPQRLAICRPHPLSMALCWDKPVKYTSRQSNHIGQQHEAVNLATVCWLSRLYVMAHIQEGHGYESTPLRPNEANLFLVHER